MVPCPGWPKARGLMTATKNAAKTDHNLLSCMMFAVRSCLPVDVKDAFHAVYHVPGFGPIVDLGCSNCWLQST